MRQKQLYLICANDRLQTAFFCGTSDECAEILDMNINTFYSALSKGYAIWWFFHIEKVRLTND